MHVIVNIMDLISKIVRRLTDLALRNDDKKSIQPVAQLTLP